MTTGSPPCITATTELVVPKSIPIILLIKSLPVWIHKSLRCRRSLGGAQVRLNTALRVLPAFDAKVSIKVECLFVKLFDYVCIGSIFYNLRTVIRFSSLASPDQTPNKPRRDG